MLARVLRRESPCYCTTGRCGSPLGIFSFPFLSSNRAACLYRLSKALQNRPYAGCPGRHTHNFFQKKKKESLALGRALALQSIFFFFAGAFFRWVAQPPQKDRLPTIPCTLGPGGGRASPCIGGWGVKGGGFSFKITINRPGPLLPGLLPTLPHHCAPMCLVLWGMSIPFRYPFHPHTFSAFWLRSSVVSVLISLISDISSTAG